MRCDLWRRVVNYDDDVSLVVLTDAHCCCTACACRFEQLADNVANAAAAVIVVVVIVVVGGAGRRTAASLQRVQSNRFQRSARRRENAPQTMLCLLQVRQHVHSRQCVPGENNITNVCCLSNVAQHEIVT